MKTKTLGIITSFIFLFCFACEKDKICIEGSPCLSKKYMPLAVGNYWIYEVQQYNFSTYAITTYPTYDTMKIIGDTIIDNEQFFTFTTDDWRVSNYNKDTTYLRNSEGYLVNQVGEIQFTAFDFDRPLYRRIIQNTNSEDYFIEYSVRDTNIVKITPEGIFNCLDYSGKVWTGLVWKDQKYHNCYAKEVGLVYQSLFTNISLTANSSATTYEIRRLLKEYHLE